MMKIKFLFLIGAAALTACKQVKPSAEEVYEPEEEEVATTWHKEVEEEEVVPMYDGVDALAFGLRGKVQRVTTQCFATYDSDGELKEHSSPSSEMVMLFDEWGHVTLDEWGDNYEYDAEGNYFRGNHTYTTVKRDSKGRIVRYLDEEPQSDNEENKVLTFEYDKRGRIASIAYNGWTEVWEEKRNYEGDRLCPSQMIASGTFEGGGGFQRTDTYRYSHFDDKGNWTEGTMVRSYTEEEEDFEAEGDSVITKTTTEEKILVERRSIEYYE